jgi:hypothetical protein
VAAAGRPGRLRRFVALIEEHGYRGRFLATVYTYLNVDGWRYSESPGLFEPGWIINRANTERAPVVHNERATATVPLWPEGL